MRAPLREMLPETLGVSILTRGEIFSAASRLTSATPERGGCPGTAGPAVPAGAGAPGACAPWPCC